MREEFEVAGTVFATDASNTEKMVFLKMLITMVDDDSTLTFIRGFIEGYSGEF